jgi:dTDP-4-dehydrorhamnose reductase
VKALVVGASGQVARALAADKRVVAVGRPRLDLAQEETFAPVLDAERPDVVICAGAWTAVDAAETAEADVMRVNAEGPGRLAAACAARDLPIIFVSSDYVFDGEKSAPYVESDPPNPRTAYGRSKLAGERAVAAATPHHAIVRTSWVFDAEGKNFLRTMLRLAREQGAVRVVADQIGAPTYAPHIAAGLLQVAENLARGEGYGTFHMTAAGACSWAEFAEAIFAESEKRGGPSAPVSRISTPEFPTPAARPANSRLECAKVAHAHGVSMPDWRIGLRDCLDRIAAEGRFP